MPATEVDPLLPTHSTRDTDDYGLSYWIKGFHLALPKNKPAARVMLACCALEVLEGCCAFMESYLVQYLIVRDKAHLIVVSSLVFATIDPIISDCKAVLQAVTNRETHRSIMSTLERKSWDQTDNESKKGLSINKISAIDTYYQEIRALVLNLVTLAFSIGSLVANSWSVSSFLVVICLIYSILDNTFDATDILHCHATTHDLLAAKSQLSGRSLVDTYKQLGKLSRD